MIKYFYGLFTNARLWYISYFINEFEFFEAFCIRARFGLYEKASCVQRVKKEGRKERGKKRIYW